MTVVANWQCQKCGEIMRAERLLMITKKYRSSLCYCGATVVETYVPWTLEGDPNGIQFHKDAQHLLYRDMREDGLIPPDEIEKMRRGNPILFPDDVQEEMPRLDVVAKRTVGFAGKQQGGDHYGDPKTDVFAFCEANQIGMVASTAIKYNARLGNKGERDQWIMDARKAIQCTERRCSDLGISLEDLYGE
jgi:hypothetical protein